MRILVEDLDVGDEILIPSGVTFKRLRVKRKPKINKNTGCYGSVLTDIYNENIKGTYSQYNFTYDEYNDTFRFQVDRPMWLIKKRNNGN